MEVRFDHEFELSDLNNPCSSAFLAPKCFSELNVPGKKKKEGQISSIDLLASPQVKTEQNNLSLQNPVYDQMRRPVEMFRLGLTTFADQQGTVCPVITLGIWNGYLDMKKGF